MASDYDKLFANLSAPEPKSDLLADIISAIKIQEIKSARRRSMAYGGIFVTSLIALVPAFSMFWKNLISSGFIDFISLAVSDFGSVLSYWQFFGATLLETMPVISLIVFLAVILMMMQSLKKLSETFRFKFLIHNS